MNKFFKVSIKVSIMERMTMGTWMEVLFFWSNMKCLKADTQRVFIRIDFDFKYTWLQTIENNFF